MLHRWDPGARGSPSTWLAGSRRRRLRGSEELLDPGKPRLCALQLLRPRLPLLHRQSAPAGFCKNCTVPAKGWRSGREGGREERSLGSEVRQGCRSQSNSATTERRCESCVESVGERNRGRRGKRRGGS
eukprot:571844-Rhodomonas_salina.3